MNDILVRKTFKSTLTIQILTALTAVLGTVVDGIVTGACLGTAAMASYGFAVPVASIYSGIAGVFSTGISVLCGRTIGSGDKEETNRIFSQGVFASVITGMILLLVTFVLADPLASLLGAEGQLKAEAVNYLRGFAFCGPAIMVAVELLPIMQLDGDRNRALKAIMATTGINIALDLLNGFVLHKGLFVMALATTISYYVGAAVLLMHFANKRAMFGFKWCRLKWATIKSILSYGLPNALQQVSRSILTICLNHIILMVAGEGAIAAYSAIFTASVMCMAVGTGISQSTSVVVSVFAGEKDVDSIRNVLLTALRTALFLNIILTALVMIGSPVMMGLFLASEPAVLDIAIHGFRIYGLCIIFYAVNVTLRSYYQSMHMVKLAYPYVLLDNFLCIVVSAYVLGRITGLEGVWLSFLTGEVFTLMIFICLGLMNRSEKTFIDKMMHIGRDFTKDILEMRTWSCTSLEQTEEISKAVFKTGEDGNMTRRNAYLLSLAVEEMCKNILQYGFTDGKSHSIDVKLMRLDYGWILRIRDNCELFDPVLYMKSFTDSDKNPESHIGIRMISQVADRMEYVSTLKLNNLLIGING